MVKWSIEIEKFDISHHPPLAIKAQVLIDFLIECTILEEKSNMNNANENVGGPR